jgi:hypothetical protein
VGDLVSQKERGGEKRFYTRFQFRFAKDKSHGRSHALVVPLCDVADRKGFAKFSIWDLQGMRENISFVRQDFPTGLPH